MTHSVASRRPYAAAAGVFPFRATVMAGVSVFALLVGLADAEAASLKSSLANAQATQAAANATAIAQSQSAAAVSAASATHASLTRATNSLRAALMAQAQAAAAAVRNSSTNFTGNGLGTGALDPITGETTWIGANAPTTASGNPNDVTIDQTQSRAILTWRTFNVGANTKLTFDQDDTNWVALNRVVGGGTAPSQILGSISAKGTVLVINQNGIVFGAGSQVNVHSLIATTAEIGRSVDGTVARTIAQRNQEFLEYGLTGYAETKDTDAWTAGNSNTFSGRTDEATAPINAEITVEKGATITSTSKGMILLAASTVTNEGHLSAADGQVSLAGLGTGVSSDLTLYASKGSSGSIDQNIRGYAIFSSAGKVVNRGVIEADRGYISLGGGSPHYDSAGTANGIRSTSGTVVNSGILSSTSSVSANGTIDLYGNTITLEAGSVIRIAPDDNGETITQSATSLAAVKPSQVRIGNSPSNIVLAGTAPDGTAGALIAAPSGSVVIGATSGAGFIGGETHVTVNDGAVIDVSGLKNVSVPISAYNLSIPLKGNELADSGGYQSSLLNGKTIMIDARLSGVREDGVAWIGSPLISAAAYYEAVGVSAAQLMTKGGTVILGTGGVTTASTASPATAASVTVNKGALIDVSGGWVTYQAGQIKTSQLLTTDGRVVDIGTASLSDSYLSVYTGASITHGRWGVVETWKTITKGLTGRTTASYREGSDAGTITIKTALAVIEGSISAAAYAGEQQLAKGTAGTATSSVYGDLRALQAARSERPSDGMLFLQLVGDADADSGAIVGAGGSDIVVVADQDYARADGKTILSDRLLSESGLAQVSLWSSGKISVAENATVSLSPGGTFDAYAGRSITIAGTVSVPSGSIRLETAKFANTNVLGSAFSSDDNILVPGSLDIVVTGTLSVAGRWVNDIGKSGLAVEGDAYLDGGSISMISAFNVIDTEVATTSATPSHSTDLGGSIRIDQAKLIDLSGGGRVDKSGRLHLTGKGGDLSLINQTAYFQTVTHEGLGAFSYIGQVGGFRGHFVNSNNITVGIAVNPDKINSTVTFNPDSIRAAGFAGGGTFTLWSPEIKFGSGSGTESALATALPLSFFQKGFSAYAITSYKTDLLPNTLTNASGNSLGGYNAILTTQTFTIKAGETLTLSQSLLPSVLSESQTTALRQLASGGDVASILTAAVPTNMWDQKPVDLTLDGMVELVVEQGGKISAAPGATLTVAKLKNQGLIRLPGGVILQNQTLPSILDPKAVAPVTVYAGHDLDDIFSIEADGTILEAKTSIADPYSSNASVAYHSFVYLLGEMEASDGIVLTSGSVTDLSGVSVLNPYATGANGLGIRTGAVYGGGTIATAAALSNRTDGFYQTDRLSTFLQTVGTLKTGRTLEIASGASLSLDGASDTFTQSVTTVSASGLKSVLSLTQGSSQAVWSDAGTISAPNGFTIASDATISAKGGSSQAEGGTLDLADVVLTQSTTNAANELAADQIKAAGFTTLNARGRLGSDGNVSLVLDRALFVTSRPFNSGVLTGSPTQSNTNAVTLWSGGTLDITAPYIGLLSSMDVLSSTTSGTPSATNTVTLTATKAFDIAGAVLFDRSVATTNLISQGDLRLSGVQDYNVSYLGTAATDTPLTGRLAVNGALSIKAAQIYPTTGSTFAIGATGAITFTRATSGSAPAAPYSAGGSLTVTGSVIHQGGVIRVPLGSLTLDATTGTLTLDTGSYTEVSANGLIIPYGTTTDGTEWYFTPNGGTALSALPEKVMTLRGDEIDVKAGATLNISGGGDATAYEFSAGTGGSRDVLNTYNSDPYTSKTGCTYAGCATAYAIVPGLSDASVAAYDPVYSANYASLTSASEVGKRVQLNLGDGLKWYTLLPAQYASLPGGVLVVEQTATTTRALGSYSTRADGTVLATGVFGDALSGASEPTLRLFAVQSQSVFKKFSTITLTSANDYFSELATEAGTVTPALPVDAGRLVLDAITSLIIKAHVSAAAGEDGRGSKVDIGGTDILIGTADNATVPTGTLYISADSLSNLNAESLLIGAVRTDKSDGTTSLSVSATSITLANDDDHPLTAPEIVLAAKSSIDLADGSAITASGTMADTRSGAYVIGDSTTPGTGIMVRAANGPERLTDRTNYTEQANLSVGAATISGTSVMFDTSGTMSISNALKIKNATSVAMGAGRIGIGAIPGYTGAIVTPDMINVLTQSGGRLTLRSQTSIDFADGNYSFGNIRFDASTLAGAEGGAVTVSATTVTLGNSGTSNRVCTSCESNNGTLSIAANEILFSGGTIATKATTTGAATATLAADIMVTLPKGTAITANNGVLAEDAQILLPKGMVVSLTNGTGLIGPTALADGILAAGTEITVSGSPSIEASGKSFVVSKSLTYRAGLANYTVAAGESIVIATPLTISIPTASAYVLKTETAVSTKNFFAGGVDLTAKKGIFTTGAAGGLDTGSASLTLHTPYLGDRASSAAAGSTIIPSLTLATQSALKINTVGAGSIELAKLGGIPGAGLVLKGNAVEISGTTLHASAGSIDIVSETGITLRNGAVVEAPSYTASFGDSTDSTSATAAAGRVSLTAKAGDIDIGSGTTVSVKGGTGSAGRLELSAVAGDVIFDGTIDGSGATGGVFALESNGPAALVPLNTLIAGKGFTGGFEVHTLSGDLVLSAGETLTSGSVVLTADGGRVAIGGIIDTSGVNGGDITLYGREGVTLEATSRLDAHAKGYASTDPRQAKGGDVTLGTDFATVTGSTADGAVTGTSGTILVKRGAVINVGATQTANRLIPLDSGLGSYYVDADVGGTVTFRAPIVDAGGQQTVDIQIDDAASSVKGARKVTVEGFRRWDLAKVANSTNFTGVTLSNGSITLNAAAGMDTLSALCGSGGGNCALVPTVVSGLNFLSDRDESGTHETVVSFVQDFDISASSANLGGLDTLTDADGASIFHAAPGVELAYEGNITLASSWNLAAGAVDVTKASTAGLMQSESYNGTSVDYVVSGAESEVMSKYTAMLYRTGQSIVGEAPVLTLRSGGDLTINGIINDGFFSFRDTSNETYLLSKTGIAGSNIVSFSSGYTTTYAAGYPTYGADGFMFSLNTSGDIFQDFTARTAIPAVAADPLDYVPYSPSANSAAPPQTGNPFASMDLLPTVDASSQMTSSSYRLVGGAAVSRQGADLKTGTEPTGTNPASTGSVIVNGYSYTTSTSGTTTKYVYNYTFFRSPIREYREGIYSSASDWLENALNNSNLNYGMINNGYGLYFGTTIGNYYQKSLGGNGPTVLVSAKSTSDPNYMIDSLSDLIFVDLDISSATFGRTLNPSADGKDGWTGVTFRDYVKSGADPYLYALYYSNATTVTGASATYTAKDGTAITGGNDFFTVVGVAGTAKNNPYTTKDVSRLALLVSLKTFDYILNTYFDPILPTEASGGTTTTTKVPGLIRTGTGDIGIAAAGTVDLTAGEAVNSTANAVAVYTAGQRAESKTVTAVNVATNTPATVTLNATPSAGGLYLVDGGDLSITAGKDVLGRNGSGDPFSTSPALFTTGIGALAGGDIAVSAGRDIDTVVVAANTATRTVSVDGTANGIQFLNDSDVSVTAGRDILGGVISVASGNATVTAQRDIASSSGGTKQTRLYYLNATATIAAARNASLIGSNTSPQWSKVATLNVTAGGDIDIGASGWPGSVTLAALTGDLTFRNPLYPSQRASILMMPAADGQLVLLAGGEIGTVSLVMLDTDPAYVPGPFYNSNGLNGAIFPTVNSRTTLATLNLYHNQDITHRDDKNPLMVFAGGDITDVTLVSPKQARVVSGGDIVNMVFFGQNLSATDITRIAAAGDITATSAIVASSTISPAGPSVSAAVVQGNTFVIGGPGSFFLEAGGNIGPFLNSANVTIDMKGMGTDWKSYAYGGGVLSVGYDWNPWLKDAVVTSGGADLYVMFGLGKTGPAYDSFREIYVNPTNAGALTWGGYGADLVAWMQARHSEELTDAYHTTDISDDQAYAEFLKLSPLEQRVFLLSKVYFNELKQVAVTTSPSYQKYSRGYDAVNALFPAANGYTANGLEGGASDTARVHTGDLDLRLATLQTTRGGDIRLIGPGGDILAGSVVRTSTQAERRNYYWPIYTGENGWANYRTVRIDSIPVGLEGIITLRGGEIDSFTDGSLVLNQSRLFTQNGGDIVLWSSNADLNAGQGPKTSANYPPISLRFDWNLFAEIDEQAGVAGAGIAAFQPEAGITAPDVYMLAPRGTVDAGDAGIRVAGNLSILAYQVRNADNISVAGQSFGVPVAVGPNLGALTSASDTAAAAAGAAEDAARVSRQTGPRNTDLPSIITFEVVGYGGGDGSDSDRRQQRERSSLYNPNGAVRFTSLGESDTTLRR
ncbi:filamentous haemagglutinin family protein [Magnetospirillum fulvum]|uniref:Filamentous hemagglutinin family N-terminal domain-containing protein n=1 Tax=Magnetospirillum fulvum TaxID=1082 RepID=A0A1H6JZH8_MAGFU|nr:filamentous haemagglutinin family protein [Magnetospirillum fulvum]SEH66038.1 filamentous hemagglutinin family N-terminal domain-containing protein [Magnetospirillum fulvum]